MAIKKKKSEGLESILNLCTSFAILLCVAYIFSLDAGTSASSRSVAAAQGSDVDIAALITAPFAFAEEGLTHVFVQMGVGAQQRTLVASVVEAAPATVDSPAESSDLPVEPEEISAVEESLPAPPEEPPQVPIDEEAVLE